MIDPHNVLESPSRSEVDPSEPKVSPTVHQTSLMASFRATLSEDQNTTLFRPMSQVDISRS